MNTPLTLKRVPPPRSEFYAEEEVRKERAEVLEIFTRIAGGASRKAMSEELNITLADPNDPDDAIAQTGVPSLPRAGGGQGEGAEFAASASLEFPDQVALDKALDALILHDQSALLEPLLRPLIELARTDPDGFLGRMAEQYQDMDSDALAERLARVLFVANTWGRLSAQDT